MLRKISPVVIVWLLGFWAIGGAIVGFVERKPDNLEFNILSFFGLGFLVGYLVVKLESRSAVTTRNNNKRIREFRTILLFFLTLAFFARDDLELYMFFAVGVYMIVIATALTYWVHSKEIPLTWKDFA